MWRVSGYDWKATSSRQIEERLSDAIEGGEVILLHDGGHKAFGTDRSHTVKATDTLLREYREKGFDFVNVPEMMVGNSRASVSSSQ